MFFESLTVQIRHERRDAVWLELLQMPIRPRGMSNLMSFGRGNRYCSHTMFSWSGLKYETKGGDYF